MYMQGLKNKFDVNNKEVLFYLKVYVRVSGGRRIFCKDSFFFNKPITILLTFDCYNNFSFAAAV